MMGSRGFWLSWGWYAQTISFIREAKTHYFEKGGNVVNFLFDYKVPGGYNNVKGCQMAEWER